jgi:hypothetical protein
MATLKPVENNGDNFANALARRFQKEHTRAVTRSYKRIVRMAMEDADMNETDARIWLKKYGVELPSDNGK